MSDPTAPEAGSTRPYLVRAIHDWCLDNALTPQIMVDATLPGVAVPQGFADDGRIVLNLHPNAVRGLELGDEYLMFSARFSGRAEEIAIPVEAVLAVYARENGQGIVFQADGSGITPPSPPGRKPGAETGEGNGGKDGPDSDGNDTDGKGPKPGSHLKVVK